MTEQPRSIQLSDQTVDRLRKLNAEVDAALQRRSLAVSAVVECYGIEPGDASWNIDLERGVLEKKAEA